MEKRVLFGLVLMLMYLVGSCVGEGEVKLMTEKAKWEQSLTTTQLPLVIAIISSDSCGHSCDVVEDQLARLAHDYPDKIQFITGDITSQPSLKQLYNVANVPTVIVSKDGTTEAARYDSLSDWTTLFYLIIKLLFGSALPPSGSGSGSATASTSASGSPIPSPDGQ